MKRICLIGTVLSLVLSSTSFAASDARLSDRLNKNGVALCADRSSRDDSQCYDPVSYLVDNKAQAVSSENGKKFRTKYKNAVYVFSSQAHLDLFTKDPEKYLPQYGGWCAYAVAAKSDKVDIDPKSFHVQNGRLLLFYDGFFGDTRKTWLTDKSKSPTAYIQDADAHWPAVEGKDP